MSDILKGQPNPKRSYKEPNQTTHSTLLHYTTVLKPLLRLTFYIHSYPHLILIQVVDRSLLVLPLGRFGDIIVVVILGLSVVDIN